MPAAPSIRRKEARVVTREARAGFTVHSQTAYNALNLRADHVSRPPSGVEGVEYHDPRAGEANGPEPPNPVCNPQPRRHRQKFLMLQKISRTIWKWARCPEEIIQSAYCRRSIASPSGAGDACPLGGHALPFGGTTRGSDARSAGVAIRPSISRTASRRFAGFVLFERWESCG